MRIIEENKRLAAAGPSTLAFLAYRQWNSVDAMEASEHDWISMPASLRQSGKLTRRRGKSTSSMTRDQRIGIAYLAPTESQHDLGCAMAGTCRISDSCTRLPVSQSSGQIVFLANARSDFVHMDVSHQAYSSILSSVSRELPFLSSQCAARSQLVQLVPCFTIAAPRELV